MSGGYGLAALRGLLIAVASLAWHIGSRAMGFSSCGMRALVPLGVWDFPGPGITPVSLALAGGLLTTVPLGKS